MVAAWQLLSIVITQDLLDYMRHIQMKEKLALLLRKP